MRWVCMDWCLVENFGIFWGYAKNFEVLKFCWDFLGYFAKDWGYFAKYWGYIGKFEVMLTNFKVRFRILRLCWDFWGYDKDFKVTLPYFEVMFLNF